MFFFDFHFTGSRQAQPKDWPSSSRCCPLIGGCLSQSAGLLAPDSPHSGKALREAFWRDAGMREEGIPSRGFHNFRLEFKFITSLQICSKAIPSPNFSVAMLGLSPVGFLSAPLLIIWLGHLLPCQVSNSSFGVDLLAM